MRGAYWSGGYSSGGDRVQYTQSTACWRSGKGEKGLMSGY